MRFLFFRSINKSYFNVFIKCYEKYHYMQVSVLMNVKKVVSSKKSFIFKICIFLVLVFILLFRIDMVFNFLGEECSSDFFKVKVMSIRTIILILVVMLNIIFLYVFFVTRRCTVLILSLFLSVAIIYSLLVFTNVLYYCL